MRATDIEALRASVETYCSDYFLAKAGLVWEGWLEVLLRGSDFAIGRDAMSEDLRIEYRPLKRGRHPDDQTRDFTLTPHGTAVPFPTPKRAGFDEREHLRKGIDQNDARTWNLGARDTDVEVSYLPDTPANSAALDHLITSLRLLRLRLSDFLEQENIGQAVVALQQQALALPGPTAPAAAKVQDSVL